MPEAWRENLAGFPSSIRGGSLETWQAAESPSLAKVTQFLGCLSALLCPLIPICKMGGLEN